MSRYEMKLPDVGEGVAEAEIVAWLVAVGEEVTPDTVLAEVLTDKATVEVSPPVAGTVVQLFGEPGDVLSVGSSLIVLDVADGVEPDPATDAGADPAGVPGPEPQPIAAGESGLPDPEPQPVAAGESGLPAPPQPVPTASGDTFAGTARPTAAPAVRKRAAELGIDLAAVAGTGPDGRVVHGDLDRLLTGGSRAVTARAAERSDRVRVEPVRGVRRKIAERLSAAWSDIPHITYVEAVDVTELEALRAKLNPGVDDRVRLTLLPFLVRAIVIACGEQPGLNAHYDHAAETLTIPDAVHVGIATQTDSGLMVPVVRHAEARDLRDLAAEIVRVTEAARSGSATREELSGSTITVTSLGALGGVATTPIINAPEVSIVGVNKMETRPVWRDGSFQPRRMLNLSSSFDHRMIDGWDAATFVQRVTSLLETPALLFVDD